MNRRKFLINIFQLLSNLFKFKPKYPTYLQVALTIQIVNTNIGACKYTDIINILSNLVGRKVAGNVKPIIKSMINKGYLSYENSEFLLTGKGYNTFIYNILTKK